MYLPCISQELARLSLGAESLGPIASKRVVILGRLRRLGGVGKETVW